MVIDKLNFFHQATIRICGSLDIEKALWRCYGYLESLMPVKGINLHLFESGMSEMRSIAQVTAYEMERLKQIVHVPDEVRAALERGWLEKSDVMVFNQPDKDPVMRVMMKFFGKPDRSVMVMRLEIEGNRIGAISMYADGRDQYTSEHADLLSMLHDPIAIAMSNAVKHQEVLLLKDALADDNKYLHRELQRLVGDEIIGAETGLKKVMAKVFQVASFNSPVLLLGETGVGKEIVANAIHNISSRKDGPFIKVNCGAIPESLLDSELFGHEKGAFTGAVSLMRGRFERAHKGTILLDEIGELPHAAQVRLLRVVQNKELNRVGGTTPIPVDIRIIAATHRDLEEMVNGKEFREDLWFRLSVFPIRIPPLKERKEDIPALVKHFVQRKSKELNLNIVPEILDESLEKMNNYQWRGNVRELENVVERALIQYRGMKNNEPLRFEMPSVSFLDQEDPVLKNEDKKICKLDDLVEKHICSTLDITAGKIHGPGGAADILGINPHTLRSKMRKLGIPFRSGRS